MTATASTTVEGVKVTGSLIIKYIPGPLSLQTSSISADPAVIVADPDLTSGNSSTITYQPKDALGNAITSIAPDTISENITGITGSVPTLTAWELKNNVYTATLKAGTKTGSVKVIPIINSQEAVSLQTPLVTLIAGALDVTQSTITAKPSAISANNGSSTSTLVFTPKDKYSNTITNLNKQTISQRMTVQAGGTSANWEDLVSLNDGSWDYSSESQTYNRTVWSGTQGGTLDIMPLVNGSDASTAANGATGTLQLVYNSSVSRIDISKSDESAVADASSYNTVTFTVYGQPEGGNAAQPLAGKAVKITLPSASELLIGDSNSDAGQRQNATYEGTTDNSGKLTVRMSSTRSGDNSYAVESDYNAVSGSTAVGVYVSETHSTNTELNKMYLINDGSDYVKASFYPRDLKGRLVSGLTGITFTTTLADATLSAVSFSESEGYSAMIRSSSTYFGNYFVSTSFKGANGTILPPAGNWNVPDTSYTLRPVNALKLGTLKIVPKLCGTTTSASPAVFDSCQVNSSADGYYYSGLGFVVVMEDNAPGVWDGQFNLKSTDVSGDVGLTTLDGSITFACTQPVSRTDAWMNDFYASNDYSVDITLKNIGDQFDTYSSPATGTVNGGAGICNIGWKETAKKVRPLLTGSGEVKFTITTQHPSSLSTLTVPLSGERIDRGVLPDSKAARIDIYSSQ
ncbi:MAG: hypothetical protein XXXJIFNMEKO3_03236 [Candidatus Erwinia impunctatus]